MLKEEPSDGGSGGNNWARVCDTCRSAACTVYCRADSAYLCAECDARVHAANRVASRHERVWVCEACERAPAAFLCKADAASLCAECDAEIHSANPLARRHQRVPILPISGSLYGGAGSSATGQGGQKMASSAVETEDGFIAKQGDETIVEEDEDEAASWLLLNPGKNSNNQNNGFLFNGEVEEYLDLMEYNSSVENQFNDQYNQQQQQHFGVLRKSYDGDSVVPIQSGGKAKDHLQQQQQQHQNFQYGLDYDDSSKTAYSYNGSISHTVSKLCHKQLFTKLVLHVENFYSYSVYISLNMQFSQLVVFLKS